ncbi:MAG: ComEA family DNA-binding protein [Faecousia sp.]
MKKAYSALCVFLALFLVVSLWGIHYLRNNYQDILSPNPLPPSDKVFAIDINTAGIDELCCLPGIGEVLAQRIIDYRNEHGDFTYISQIQNVKGIGEEKYKEIEPYLVIGD